MHAARTNWAKSSQFKFQHVRFFFAFWVTAEKWFKLHKVPILPSVLVQSSQIICLLPNQFESQTCDSSKLQKVHILPSVLGQCYKDPQMVLKMTTTKRFDWNLQKISGFVIEMNHIKSDYSQTYTFRRRWWVDWEGPRYK